MKINSVQSLSYSKKQANFGCRYCRLTKELLADFKGDDVEGLLKKINPEILDSKMHQIMRENGTPPMELHLMRAEVIYSCFLEAKKILRPGFNLYDAVVPGKLETLITAFRDKLDDAFASAKGIDYFTD